jgi:hypothetical protein
MYAQLDMKKKAFNKDIGSLMEKYEIKVEIRDGGGGEPFFIAIPFL